MAEHGLRGAAVWAALSVAGSSMRGQGPVGTLKHREVALNIWPGPVVCGGFLDAPVAPLFPRFELAAEPWHCVTLKTFLAFL